jgi:hypothetical protein
MKKIYLLILASVLTCSSCSDFLEEVPRDEMSSNQFFSQPAHAHNAVNSLYRNGAPQIFNSAASYGGSRAMLGNYMSGFFDNEYKGQEPHVQHSQQLTLNGNNLADYLGNIWADLYRGIARANNAIKYIPTTPGLPDNESKKLLAEAKFFRAYAYYYLVRMYGPVPLVTEPYESLDELYVERAPIKEIYDLITADLEFAVEEGGLSKASMAGNGNRITEGTAATLLAEVYLTMSGYPLQENRYADAAAMAKRVINSGPYSLTQHNRDDNGNVDLSNSAYNKLRKADVTPNEYIYFIEYTVGIAHNNYPVYTLPVAMASEVAYGITNGAYLPVPEFLWGYDKENDLRVQEKQYFHSSLTKPNGSTLNFRTAPYMWYDDNAIFETAASGKDIVVYSYADVLLIAAEAIAKSEGVTGEAVNYLAQVKDRAYWKKDISEIKIELSGLSADQFVEQVWSERYRELVFEFSLWFDIQRTRKFPVTSENSNGQISYVNVVGQTNQWGRTIEEKHLLFPLPVTELQRNPSLGGNNPGY